MGICIAYYNLKEGFGVASFDCGHWAQLGKVTLKGTLRETKCPVCAEIKAAKEEVLEWLIDYLMGHCTGQPDGLVAEIWQAYKERLGE